ncbi:MAG: STAS domain-containing protein [Actinobacteria bacterium]|nr:STAS domain-containing protein [Actinomycetota bacterium]
MNRSGCSIHRKMVDGMPLLALRGVCDKLTATATKKIIQGLLDMDERTILLDMSDLVFTDEASYRILNDCCKNILNVEGYLILINPKPEVLKAADQMPLGMGCVVVNNLEEALIKAKKKAA